MGLGGLAGGWIQSAGALGAITALVLGGIAVIFISLTYAELASAMPQTGGEHVYSYRAMGSAASFVCTWAVVLGYVSVVAFEAVALPTVIEYLLPNYKQVYLWTVAGWNVYLTWALVGVVGSLVMTAVNFFGIKTAALLQKVVTLLIIAVGLMFISGALFEGDPVNMEPLSLSSEQMASSNLVVADAMSAVFNGSWAGKLLVMAGIGGINLESGTNFSVGLLC